MFGPKLCIMYNFWFGLVHFKPKVFDFFSVKIVTSLTHIFTMEKALFKMILWHKNFICELTQIFCTTFKTF